MTAAERAAIRARANAASPGPWSWRWYGQFNVLCDANVETVVDDGSAGGEGSPVIVVPGPNAVFLAHARSDIPALCDALDEADRTIATLIENLRVASLSVPQAPDEPCPQCAGKGTILNAGYRCPTCNGSGVLTAHPSNQ